MRVGPLEDLPFEDGRFDLVLATDVIEHLEDDGPALTELRRVAAPGRLLLTVPAYQWLWSQHDVSFHHFRRFTRGMLDRARSRAGLGAHAQHLLLQHDAARRWPGCARSSASANGNGKSDFQRTPEALNRWLELPVRGEAAADQARRVPARGRLARHGMHDPLTGDAGLRSSRSSSRSSTRRRCCPSCTSACASSLAGLPGGYEVVYVDDGSTDGSAALIEGWARAEEDIVARPAVAQLRHGGRDVGRARPRPRRRTWC